MLRDDADGDNTRDADFGPREEEIREQDRFLPVANIARIMKRVLPPNEKIAKDAKEALQECVSEFICFVTSEASDRCQTEKRKTINGDDLVWVVLLCQAWGRFASDTIAGDGYTWIRRLCRTAQTISYKVPPGIERQTEHYTMCYSTHVRLQAKKTNDMVNGQHESQVQGCANMLCSQLVLDRIRCCDDRAICSLTSTANR